MGWWIKGSWWDETAIEWTCHTGELYSLLNVLYSQSRMTEEKFCSNPNTFIKYNRWQRISQPVMNDFTRVQFKKKNDILSNSWYNFQDLDKYRLYRNTSTLLAIPRTIKIERQLKLHRVYLMSFGGFISVLTIFLLQPMWRGWSRRVGGGRGISIKMKGLAIKML